jgi:carbon-monoxide dehydrogenase small subunit
MSERFHDIAVTVNGETVRERVEARRTLVDFLRETLALTGTHIGCEHGLCGACSVRIDGEVVRGCLTLAVQCDGADVLTVEGLEQGGALHAIQQAFHEEHGLQCGYCTPGMLVRAWRLLQENPNPSEQEIRDGLAGNLCRCTGYQNIVKAVQSAARKLAAAQTAAA